MKKEKTERNEAHKIISDFVLRDVLQVIVGTIILAIPVAFTEESWMLGKTLPLANILGIMLISILAIFTFTYYHYHHHAHNREKKADLIKRVTATYLLSFLVVTILLSLIQAISWSTNAMNAFQTTVLIALPASMSAAIADTLK